jgi:hypothetical protein
MALYTLHYIHSTHDYGINFTSLATAPIPAFVHFHDLLDVEAYSDVTPPTPTHSSLITSCGDVCWGSQIELAVQDGSLLLLFAFSSMSGGIIFCQGGPISWLVVRQDCTSLSSYEAEIHATNKIFKMLMGICHLTGSVVIIISPMPLKLCQITMKMNCVLNGDMT